MRLVLIDELNAEEQDELLMQDYDVIAKEINHNNLVKSSARNHIAAIYLLWLRNDIEKAKRLTRFLMVNRYFSTGEIVRALKTFNNEIKVPIVGNRKEDFIQIFENLGIYIPRHTPLPDIYPEVKII